MLFLHLFYFYMKQLVYLIQYDITWGIASHMDT